MFGCLVDFFRFVIETDMVIAFKKKIELQKIKKKIENQIKKEKKKNTKSFKILIFGTAESGKSTFLNPIQTNVFFKHELPGGGHMAPAVYFIFAPP